MPSVTIRPSYSDVELPEQRDSMVSAAICYQQAEKFYRERNLVGAVNELVKAVKQDPDYLDARIRLEYWSEELEDVTHEVEQLRDSISHNPDSAEDHYNLARKLLLLGDMVGALAEWQKVIELDQDTWGKSARKMLHKYASTKIRSVNNSYAIG